VNEVPARRCTAGALILLLATPAFAARDQDDRDRAAMVCVPAEDGRSWECGTRENPPPERGLSVLPRPSTAAAPPPFLAAPGASRASPVPALSPPASTPGAPTAPRANAARVAPLTESTAAAIEPLPARDENATAPRARASDAQAARSDPPAVAAPAPVADAPARSAPTPPPLLAAPRPRLAPYAPLAPAATAERPAPVAPAVAQPAAAQPVAAPRVAAEPVVAEPVVAEPVVAEPVVAEPVVAEPVVAEPVVAEPVVAEPVVAEPVRAETAAPQIAASTPADSEPASTRPATIAAPVERMPPPQPTRARVDEIVAFAGDDDFLALPSSQFTIQIARAARAGLLYAEFQRLRALGIDGLAERTPYIVTLGRGDDQQTLLLWGSFADAAAARAAWDTLPAPEGGKPPAYPRRIAPLQDEVRRTLSNR
jgi:hypothetical protein